MKSNVKSRIIYLIVYLAYTSIYISRVTLSVANPALESLGVFDAAGYGLIGGLFSTVYSIGRLFNGDIGDRTPPWIMLSVGLGVGGIAMLGIGMLPPYIGILLLWGVNAYAQSMLWSSVLCVVSDIYEGERAKSMSSLMVTAVATGNILSILLGGWLISAVGVQVAFVIPGALNILLGAAVVICTRRVKPKAVQRTPGGVSLFSHLKNKDILLMSVPSMLHGVMKENVGVWMVAYAAAAFGANLSESQYYVLLIPIIGLVGRLLYPLVLGLARGRENTVSFFAFLACGAASVLLLWRGLGLAVAVVALGVVYATTSMINSSMCSIYPLAYKESGNVSSVSGLLDFASYLGAGISSAIYGVIISNFGYEPMFISWAVLSVVSALMLIIIKKRRDRVGREKMRLSVEVGIFKSDVGYKDGIRRISEAGFDCFDMSYFRSVGNNDILGEDYIERARELRAYADSLGITCNQAHAPFKLKPGDTLGTEGEEYTRILRSIESAAIMGAPAIVVHAVKYEENELVERNRAFYLSLLPTAQRCGIKIAVENLFHVSPDGSVGGIFDDPGAHQAFVRSLGSDSFTICLDIGHSGITGHAPEEVISAMDKELLTCLHVHDNDGVSDLHATPFLGSFRWDKITSALKKIGYR